MREKERMKEKWKKKKKKKKKNKLAEPLVFSFFLKRKKKQAAQLTAS